MLVLVLLVGALLVAVGWRLSTVLSGSEGQGRGERGPASAAAVEVVRVERGPIALQRVLSGTLEATAGAVVAPKVGGTVERVLVDLGDAVERGRVVAELEDAEYRQEVASAEASLAVAQANLVEAQSAAEIARRSLSRNEALRERGVASESQLDTVRAEALAADSAVKVARAEVQRAEAALEGARIRLSYTRVRANWSGSDADRVVAERFLDEGETVAANTPLLQIVQLHPIIAVVFVTEKDYGELAVGQPVTLTTDAFVGETFTGRVSRIAPVFGRASRQARVELTVENPDGRLKPGMFVRATVVLRRVDDAVKIPLTALTTRSDRPGVFVVDRGGESVSLVMVQPGIEQGDWVEVRALGESASGGGSGSVPGAAASLVGREVVVLGHQLLDDGTSITIPQREGQAEAGGAGAGLRSADAGGGIGQGEAQP